MKPKVLLNLLYNLNWFYTFYFNFKFFSFKEALSFPIWIFGSVSIHSLKGNIKILDKIKPGIIRFGEGDLGIFDKKLKSVFNIHGEIIFTAVAHIGKGCAISVAPGTKLLIGRNFKITAKSSIIVSGGSDVIFGDNCLLSWDVLVMNTDFHEIIDKDTGKVINLPEKITLSDHVWVGSGAKVLKGAFIPPHSVIAANSIVTGKLTSPYTIYAGAPSKQIKTNINWQG